jgi:hypothetical protein
MAFCSKCGAELAAAAAYCGSCGTGAATTNSASFSEGSTSGASAHDLTEAWKERFALIEKAGGVKLPKLGELESAEKRKVLFNIWGLLFAPFYYLAKGMWKKAIVLAALSIVIALVMNALLGESRIVDLMTNLIAPALFAVRANVDFYKKTILGDNNWW